MEPYRAFLAILCIFHASEFALACIFMRKDLSVRSTLLSIPYCIAMACSSVEYYLERRWFETLHLRWVSVSGAILVGLGEMVRKSAMITAQHNFTHMLQRERRDEHVLVKHGIYRYIRHPGYLGFMLWCMGTQLLLVNPFCLIAFTVVMWRFFRERIAVEEEQLVGLFGRSYLEYASNTPTRIPFIPGFQAEEAASRGGNM